MKIIKKRAFTLIEFLITMTIFSIILIGINRTFTILNYSLVSKRTEVAIYNDMDTINTNLEYFKYLTCDITIITNGDSKEKSSDPGVYDEIYITDINNPNNYFYMYFKDNEAYITKGADGKEVINKLKTIENISIKQVNKVLISENSKAKYIDVDDNNKLIEMVINFNEDFSIRLVKSFKTP